MNNLRRLPAKQLKRLLDRGIVGVSVIPEFQAFDVNKIPITAMPDFAPFKKLHGKPISINAGARKYNIPPRTVSRWVPQLKIPKLGKGPHGAVLIDEGVLAYYATKYKKISPGPGRRTDRLF